MRVLINYATYADRVTIHCVAEDARALVVPHKPVSSLETLYRLIAHVGSDPEQCRKEINKWGHGSVWADVRPEHFERLGIKKPTESQPGLSTSKPPNEEGNHQQRTHDEDEW